MPHMNKTARGRTAAILIAAFLASAEVRAADGCGLCVTSLVTNSALAQCFLDRYADYAEKDSTAVAVDLHSCEETMRFIIDPLPNPLQSLDVPDLSFLVARKDLACLKRKLENPNLVLDPVKRIDLGDCG